MIQKEHYSRMTRDLPVQPQTDIHLSAYVVKAFVSPIRLEVLGVGQVTNGSTDRPTKDGPNLHAR